MIRRVLFAALALVGLLTGVMAAFALSLKPRQQSFPAVNALPSDSPEAMASRMAFALKLITVTSGEQPHMNAAAELHAYIERTFPLIHQKLRRELINGQSLLYTWEGTDGSLPAALFIGHQDVVPTEPHTLPEWSYPPFEGKVADGFVWGRGALDDKSRVFAVLEAAETLLRSGFVPKRTVYFAFGHDEEVGGTAGAHVLAAALKAKGAKIEFLVDEGLPVTQGVLAGVAEPVAAIGVAEKGVVNVQLTVDSEGGHGSLPPPNTAAGILGAAVARIEAKPFPARGGPHIALIGDYAAPHMPFAARFAFANRWLLRPLIMKQLQKKPGTAALTRTTAAVTMLQGSDRPNVLPSKATAVINVRMLPGDTADGVLAYFRDVIHDDRVKVSVLGELHKQSPVYASTESRGFKAVERASRETRPDAIVVPTLFVATSDCPHYAELTTDAYRHSPYLYGTDDLKRLHGINERVAVAEYAKAVFFYQRLLTHSASE